MQTEQCSNCETIIGKLETAHIFCGNIVCSTCKIKLDKTEKGMLENLPRGYDGDNNATREELKIAHSLGLSVSDSATRDQVRKLIDWKTGKYILPSHDGISPTDKQIRYANFLGIQNAQTMSRSQLSDMIDLTLAQKNYDFPSSQIPHTKIVNNRPQCRFCGGYMEASKVGRHPVLRLIINLSMIFWGVVLCFIPFFFIVGVPMIVLGLFRQGRRRKVLKCTQCSAIADRG